MADVDSSWKKRATRITTEQTIQLASYSEHFCLLLQDKFKQKLEIEFSNGAGVSVDFIF